MTAWNKDTTLEEQLRIHEGVRYYPYTCSAGKISIGIGRNLTDKGINEAEAFHLLMDDIEEAREEARKYHWFHGLCEARQHVVIDMIFNLGAHSFSKFKGTHAAIAAENYEHAAEHMLNSLWARQVKGRARRLSRFMRDGVKS